ncbi:hypothetical protein MNBD_GAMMA11-1155 [hydrothermal vent metagenome]|uniref:Uncharacterized protein n=1 Tax=hydrothermal vent metagenome TaxID=652676 RepID=A0A3B0Y1L4_9ZZZZ
MNKTCIRPEDTDSGKNYRYFFKNTRIDCLL